MKKNDQLSDYVIKRNLKITSYHKNTRINDFAKKYQIFWMIIIF